MFFFMTDDFSLWQSKDDKMKNEVSQIVEDCIESASQRGLFLLGTQGGYINIPIFIDKDPRAHTDFGFKIPNWDTQRGDIPTIAFMENELEEYITSESLSCITHNLKTLEEFYMITHDGDFFVDTSINDHNVMIETNYPIKIKEYKDENFITVSEFNINIPNLRLGDLYKLAVEIYNLESQTYLFEELTLDQIRSANDYSSQDSVPTEGMTFSCGRRIWTVPQIKNNVINLNNNNFKYLQFIGTYPKKELYDLTFNDEYTSKEGRAYYDNFYTFPLINPKKTFENYDVNVLLPSTQVNNRDGFFQRDSFRTFEVTPSSGNIVKSMLMEVDLGTQIPIPCIQVYHHLYEMDYDLIIKLTDYNENGNQYFFQFPLRVKIKNNEPKDTGKNILLPEPSTFNQDNYCSNQSKKYPLYVTARDTNDNYLSNVNISYKCINVKCDMGTIKKPNYQSHARLQTNFPYCTQGQIIAQKSGYHTTEKRIDTDDSLLGREVFYGDNDIELQLIPKKTFQVSASTFLIKYRETGSGKRVLDKSDGSIYLTLENKKHDFESTVFWPTDEGFMDKLEFLDLNNVKYNLSIFYMDSNNELRGFYEKENWTPNVNLGNKVQFVIPGSIYQIQEDDYLDFFEYVQNLAKKDKSYDPIFN